MKVLLVCSGGMSSSIVVKSIEKEAQKQGVAIDIQSIGSGEFEEKIKNGWQVALVAPQVRHRLDTFKKVADASGVPIAVLSPQSYSPIGGAKALAEIAQIMQTK